MLRKIPLALAIVALLLGGVAVAANLRTDTSSGRPTTSRSLDGALVSTTIKSPEEQVAFWQARADANPSDYLSRTSLGFALLNHAKVSGDLDTYTDAEAVFEQALALNPRHPGALLGLGDARGAQHDFRGQIALAEKVLAERPADVSARVAVADAHLELGDVDEAAATYETLAAAEPSAATSSRLAKVAWLRGDGGAAVDHAWDALAFSSQLELPADQAAFYLFQLATFSYRTGDQDTARTAIDRALETDPAHLGALELEPRISIAEGDLPRATAGYEQLVAVSPAADLHGELAKLYQLAGRDAEADEQIELGLALGREQVGAYPAERRHLAEFFGTYDPVLALELAQEDVATREDVGAFSTLAWALHQNGRSAEARDAMQRALDTGIDDATVHFQAGMIELALGNDQSARDHLRRALEINPRFDVIDAPAAEAQLAQLA